MYIKISNSYIKKKKLIHLIYIYKKFSNIIFKKL